MGIRFLVGLVASYLFEKWNNQFKEVIKKEIYRDDGFLLFEGNKSLSEIKIGGVTSRLG